MRLRQRGLSSRTLADNAESLEIIESYEDDKYLPSYLLRGASEDGIFHCQIATDVGGGNVRVVTMYAPNLQDWDAEFRKRSLRR